MAKRSPPLQPSPATGKRLKSQQPALASLFNPPPKSRSSEDKDRTLKGKQRLTQEDSDAAFARELAHREGIDVGALRREEKRRESSQVKVELLDDSDDSDCVIMDAEPTASTSKSAVVSTSASGGAGPSTPRKTSSTSTLAFFSPTKALPTPAGPLHAGRSLDTSIYSFSPTSDVDSSSWTDGRIPFAFLVDAFVLISATKSRLTIVRVLTNLLRVVVELDPASLLHVIYLTTNRLGPPHATGLDLGVGSQVLGKAIRDVSGLTPKALKGLSNKHGDAGDVAFEANKNVRLLIQPAALRCCSLYDSLLSLTRLRGSGSQASKTILVKKLLVAARGEEVRFLVRILAQNLRIGAVRLTLTTALARAFVLSRPKGASYTIDEDFVTKEERQMMVEKEETAGKGKGKKGKGKVKEEEESVRADVGGKMDRAEALVRMVWARHPDEGSIVAALLTSGLKDLDIRVPLSVGTPIQPMLGSITRSLGEVYERLGTRPFVSEAKLDGQRGQIHVALEAPKGDESKGVWCTEGETKIWVRLFSRHLEDMTEKYPDLRPTLAAIVARQSLTDNPLTSFIIDAEIAAIDPITSALRTFQELSYRSKKDVDMADVKIRVGVFAFDLMFLNGESLLAEPFRARRERLRSIFSSLAPLDPRCAKWELVPSTEDTNPQAVQAFFAQALEMKAEGIMVKLLDEAQIDVVEEPDPSSPSKAPRKRTRKTLPASYEPDKRADSWLKVKKDYLDNMGDSLDLVPIGAWHGSGRKAGWWSPILLGCYDEETGSFSAVCKIMSGFTDEFYKALQVRYAPDSDSTSKVRYGEIEAGNVHPAIWFRPSEVWEIRGADFTLSPVYPAAQGIVSERGISVRFPRFLKIRDAGDKGIEQATSAEQLAEMYRRQGEPTTGTTIAEEDEVEEEEDI